MSIAYPITALVTLAAAVQLQLLAIKTGRVRTQTQTPAPAMTGPDELMRALRVHGNSVEQAAPFLAALWIFAMSVGDLWAGAVGALWLVGRAIYAAGYYKAANKRGPGFAISFLAFAVLAVGGAVGVVWQAFLA